jgi:hypothetical protein
MAKGDKTKDGAWWRAPMWLGALGLLLLPLLAMQFSDEVQWSGADFAFAAALLAAACGAVEWGARRSAGACYRAAVALAALAGLVLLWINLAVGIVGSEQHPANLMFHGVVALAVVGSLLARGRPRGMAITMAAAAGAMAAIALVVFLAGWNVEALLLSAAFVLPWLAAAALFRVEIAQARSSSQTTHQENA